MDEQYNYVFKEIKKLKEEQNKQKQRGLNNFNILTAVRKPHAEVGMHSNFIYSLLDINGLHYQDDLFAKLFVEYVLNIKDFGTITDVEMEEFTDRDRRIDFTIKNNKFYIGIEMKIYAKDQDKQIYDYYNFLTEEAKLDKKQKVIIYYLTLNGKEPSMQSLNGLDEKYYKNISFKDEILVWLNKCQYEVQNITNLNNAIGYYREVIEILIGSYKNKIYSLAESIIKNENLFAKVQDFYMQNENKKNLLNELEQEVYNAYEEARNIIAENFFQKELVEFLKEKVDKIEQEFNEKEFKYKITVEKNGKNIIFGSKGYSTNHDYYQIEDKIQLTKYRYRYSEDSINKFYTGGAKNYYLDIIKNYLR
jgi:hypothetical protein